MAEKGSEARAAACVLHPEVCWQDVTLVRMPGLEGNETHAPEVKLVIKDELLIQ